MTAYSAHLPLCMLLLTALLHTTATTNERTREYRVTRRFIEIGSEQEYPDQATREVRKNSKSEEWREKSAEKTNWHRQASVSALNRNEKEAQEKKRVVKRLLKSSTQTLRDNQIHKPTTATQFSSDAKAAVSEASALKPNRVVHIPQAHSDFKISTVLNYHKIQHKTFTNSTALPLRTLSALTNHINYQPSAELAQWAAQRFKRQQTELSHIAKPSALHGGNSAGSAGVASHYNPLPAVPLPPPPPFPGNFGISPFSGGAKQSNGGNVLNAFAFAGSASSAYSATHGANSLCGGVLKSRYGTIQTPNFPHKFPTPIECVWVIDASELPITTSAAVSTVTGGGSTPTTSTNIAIIVYLTQLYVLGGLKFTEYMYYSDDYKVPAHRVFTLTEDDVTQVAWVQFSSQYLEIRFTMASLDGTHLRALDRLLDVYGFNITYEVQQEVKAYQCNTLQCRFLGHCYAMADYSSYYCACFPGFSGTDCGRGPLCEDPHTNFCQNGGTCKHIGDAAITCHCPSGFKGTKCEIPEINEITMGCTSNSTSSDCHKECDFESAGDGIILRKASKITARNGKTRYEVTIRLGANLTAFYRHMDPERRPSDHLPSMLERHVSYKNN